MKLIKLHPATLSWHNVQISGPNKYSEFLYQIEPINRRTSKLNFTGIMVIYSKLKCTSRAIRRIANTEKRGDSTAWKLLAKIMAHPFKVIR